MTLIPRPGPGIDIILVCYLDFIYIRSRSKALHFGQKLERFETRFKAISIPTLGLLLTAEPHGGWPGQSPLTGELGPGRPTGGTCCPA